MQYYIRIIIINVSLSFNYYAHFNNFVYQVLSIQQMLNNVGLHFNINLKTQKSATLAIKKHY